MLKTILVFVAVIVVARSTKCYEYRGPKSEFTADNPTCDDGDYCVTATTDALEDFIATLCTNDCSEGYKNMSRKGASFFLKMIGTNLTSEEEEAIKVECCEEDLCTKPTAETKTDGLECYKFSGEISEIREGAVKCNHGNYCAFGSVRDIAAAGCLLECTDIYMNQMKMAVYNAMTIRARLKKLPEVSMDEVVMQCCNETLCNNKLISSEGTGTTVGNGTSGENGTNGEKVTNGPAREGNVHGSLSYLLPFTLGLLSMVYSIQ